MRRLAGLAAVIVSLIVVGAVAAMTVQPVVVDMRMTGRETSAPLRVENNGPNPLPVEVRVVETDFAPDTVRASDRVSEDVIAFPPQAIIPPGETEGQSAIQILYNFQVMVNVASSLAGNPELSIVGGTEIVTVPAVEATPEGPPNADGSAGTPAVAAVPAKYNVAFTVNNAALNYGYLSSGALTFVQKNADGREIARRVLTGNDIQQMIGFGLVGPAMSRRFVAPIELATADSVQVTLAMPRRR